MTASLLETCSDIDGISLSLATQDLAGDSLGLPCARIRPLTKKSQTDFQQYLSLHLAPTPGKSWYSFQEHNETDTKRIQHKCTWSSGDLSSVLVMSLFWIVYFSLQGWAQSCQGRGLSPAQASNCLRFRRGLCRSPQVSTIVPNGLNEYDVDLWVGAVMRQYGLESSRVYIWRYQHPS